MLDTNVYDLVVARRDFAERLNRAVEDGAIEILRLGYYPAIFGTSIGFDGITVALLGQSNPIGIMLSALLERQVRAAMKRSAVEKIPILPEGRPSATPTTPRILENFDGAEWHEYVEGDRAVTNPGRVMRLAGTIAWPRPLNPHTTTALLLFKAAV